jgi:hypothetical protein
MRKRSGSRPGCKSLFKGESHREKQLPDERPEVQSQVRGRPRARVVGAGAVANGRGVGRAASAGGELTGQAGLQILRAILENEVTRRVVPSKCRKPMTRTARFRECRDRSKRPISVRKCLPNNLREYDRCHGMRRLRTPKQPPLIHTFLGRPESARWLFPCSLSSFDGESQSNRLGNGY